MREFSFPGREHYVLPMGEQREKLSYEEFRDAVCELAQVVEDSGYKPDIVLSIARGGLLIGGALGYALGVKNTFTGLP